MFDASIEKDKITGWIREYVSGTPFENVVVGISGGKDSSVVAALCVAALGRERVFGALLPHGAQADIADSMQLVNHLRIWHTTINIEKSVQAAISETLKAGLEIGEVAKGNIVDSMRMARLYAVGASLGALVANCSNLSENYVGYTTKFGTGRGDFSPLADYTNTEVKAIGRELGLPENLIEKAPADGLSPLTDEESFGFSYEVLDKYIRSGICEDAAIKAKIDKMHASTRHKFDMPKCVYNP
ncbi:MAG: NAD(+) synthase [Oscillospiraceae bacterium]|nr:NAD(+) synthase [Oscillospiraceae bacterium]